MACRPANRPAPPFESGFVGRHRPLVIYTRCLCEGTQIHPCADADRPASSLRLASSAANQACSSESRAGGRQAEEPFWAINRRTCCAEPFVPVPLKLQDGQFCCDDQACRKYLARNSSKSITRAAVGNCSRTRPLGWTSARRLGVLSPIRQDDLVAIRYIFPVHDRETSRRYQRPCANIPDVRSLARSVMCGSRKGISSSVDHLRGHELGAANKAEREHRSQCAMKPESTTSAV